MPELPETGPPTRPPSATSQSGPDAGSESMPPQELPSLGHSKLVGDHPIETALRGNPGQIFVGDAARRIGEEEQAKIKAAGGVVDEAPESKIHYTPSELEERARQSGFDPLKAPGGRQRDTLAAKDDDPRLAHGLKEFLMQMQPRPFGQILDDYTTVVSNSADGTYDAIPQPDKDLLEQQLEGELSTVIPAALRASFTEGQIPQALDTLFRNMIDPPMSRYGGDDAGAALRTGQLEVTQMALLADDRLRALRPDLAGAVSFYVARSLQRMRGDPILSRYESGWEWSAERMTETIQEERDERLENNTFWERVQSIYIELTGRTPPEIRRGAENWLHSIEQAKYSSPQDVLQDIEYMRKQIVEKGGRLHMSETEIDGLLSEIEARAYGRAAAYFMTRVPDGDIGGWAQLMKEFCRPARARERLKAAVRAYRGKVAYIDDLLHWGTHHDGTQYSEYISPDIYEGRIRDLTEFTSRQGEMKTKILSNVARKDLKDKDKVWRERIDFAINRVLAAGMQLPATQLDRARYENESIFEEILAPIEVAANAQGWRNLPQQQQALYRLGQWMMIRRSGDTLALIGRDQSPEERAQLFTEDQYNNALVDTIVNLRQYPEFTDTPQLRHLASINNRSPQEESMFRGLLLQRIEHIRETGQLTPDMEDLCIDLSMEAMQRRGWQSDRRPQWLTPQETQGFEQQLQAVTGTPEQRYHARRAILDQRDLLRARRQADERVLGELLLIKYDHGDLGLINIQLQTQQGTVIQSITSEDQTNILKRAVPGFVDAEGALGVEENLINVFLISAQLDPPKIIMDNAPANSPNYGEGTVDTGRGPERIREGSDRVPIEDIQRLLAWRRRTSNATIDLQDGRRLQLRDIQYWQTRMLHLLVKLDQPTSIRDTYPDGELDNLLNLIITPDERRIADSFLHPQNATAPDERQAINAFFHGGGGHGNDRDQARIFDRRRGRAEYLAARIERVVRAIEEDAQIVVQGGGGVPGLMQVGAAAATFTEETTGRQRSFDDIRRDMDLDPQMSGYWGPGSQQTAQYLVSEANREAAHDPEHPYYNSAIARALRVLEQRYGTIPRILTSDARLTHEITKRTEYEHREYYALMSLAWRQGYDPAHAFESRVSMGWYPNPYGGKRLNYPLPFLLMNQGNVRRGLEILPDLDFEVRGVAADHGRRGLSGFVGLIEGVGPSVTGKSGTGIDDTDTNRYIGRIIGADKSKLLYFAQAEVMDNQSRTGQLWKWMNDLANNFQGFNRGEAVLQRSSLAIDVATSEKVIKASEGALSRIFLTAASKRYLQDREYGARKSRYSFDWWYYHSVDWGLLGPGRTDGSYAPFVGYLDMMLAPMPGESDDPHHPFHNVRNAIWILRGRKVDGSV